MAIKEWNNLKIDYPTQDIKGYEEIMNRLKELKITFNIKVNDKDFFAINYSKENDFISFSTTHEYFKDEDIIQTIIAYFKWFDNDKKNLTLLKDNGYY